MTPRNASAIADFVVSLKADEIPPAIVEQAKLCLIDWCGVAIAGSSHPGVESVRQLSAGFGAHGRSLVVLGEPTAAPLAALVNGTMAHALDFDDTHEKSAVHFSSPTWAAVLALATESDTSERELLRAFVIGFEVGAQLGGGGRFGTSVNERGWHATGIFGTLAAAAAASALIGLTRDGVMRALGAAATQSGGLIESHGTMSKPLHAGKAAMHGVMSARLALHGFQSATWLLEPGGGLNSALVQDGSRMLSQFDPAAGWELAHNGFKPYACCLLSQASIDAARALGARRSGRRINRVIARVSPLALKLAGKPEPRGGLEAKFSTQFGICLGLLGFDASEQDYVDERVADPELQDLLRRTRLVPDAVQTMASAEVEVELEDGSVDRHAVRLAKGHPGNPMSDDDHWRKFRSLVEPRIGADTAKLFDVLKNVDKPGSRSALVSLLGRSRPHG